MLDGFPLYFWEFLILNLPLYRLLMSNHLQFPLGIGTDVKSGQPYMILTSYESKNAIESTGQTGHGANATHDPAKIKSSIALYIPPNALKTEFKAEYTTAEGAATKAAAGAALGRLTEGGDIGAALLAAAKGTGQSVVSKVAAQVDKGTGMLAAQGIAVNNHMALIYKGPSQFRTHDFAFSFFPKNKPEADVIKEILKDFENGMLPRMGGGMTKVTGRTLSQPLFMSPRHWTIDFFMKGGAAAQKAGGNKYLFQIKKSVITSMSVNHDQQSTVSLHEDGSPVQTTLGLQFQEIELPISDGG
jgi:hypothetical protein